MKRKYSQAQNKATQKYIKNAYDEIKLRVPKGKKETIKTHADCMGESVNGYINRLIDEDIQGMKEACDQDCDFLKETKQGE